jgi:DNA-directed RNA polymerase I subunit RPA2
MRPVKYLANERDDQIGSFEQVYMNIACTPEGIELGVSTHVEHSSTNFLSILANLIPFSDFNQVHPILPHGLLVLICDIPRVHGIFINVR